MLYSLQAPLMFIIVMFVLTAVIISVNSLVSYTNHMDFSKRSPYECGFQPFDNNIQQFDIKYYLVALLFLLFDIETIFLIPFVNIINTGSLFIFYNIIFFLITLFIGLLYEWKNNFLDWE